MSKFPRLQATAANLYHQSATWRTALFVICCPAALSASELPQYAVEKYCQEVSSAGGGSNSLYNGCIDMEQNAYNRLKALWATVPSKTRRYCSEVALVGGGSYSLLQGCIQMETSAASETSTFKY